ncbi:MAG: PilZ domain-containing protein [Geobacteraceae bacterium]
MDNLHKLSNFLQTGSEEISRDKSKSVGKRYLVNKLNYINFQDGAVLINLRHEKYGVVVSLQAKPLPCSGELLDCLWAEDPGLDRLLNTYTFDNLIVTDGKNILLVKPEVLSINERGISFVLPDTCSEISSRKMGRLLCTGISAQLIQNGAMFQGVLLDFNPVSLRIEVNSAFPQTFQWLNLESSVNLHLFAEQEALYSGECAIIRHSCDQATRTIVLEPIKCGLQRFKPKKYRSSRQQLIPSPNIVFNHPFTGIKVNLKAIDLSGSGFSVEEARKKAVLLPGMIIPELELNFANNFRIKCKAQVIYRNVGADEEDELVKCGLAILDMDIDDHLKFLSLLQQAANRDFYICAEVDMDTLWDFFFKADFIYPEKYTYFQANKEMIKKTYERLYSQNNRIARHFICQENGVISGHMAMVRFYENSWLIHHHAAVRSEHTKAGLNVLHQIGRFINDSHNLYSAHMNFVFCYFRPENKFPNRMFGGFARLLNNPERCSLDTFAYFHLKRPRQGKWDMPPLWELTQTLPQDLREMGGYYRQESGGLMLSALDLEPQVVDRNQLSQEYQKLDFKRESHLFSLRKNGCLKAIIMVNISDIGLNMSNLTNSIKAIVLDSDDLPRDIFFEALARLSTKYEENEIPVLVYPVSYAESHDIAYEKLYTMWILSMQHTDDYFRYIEGMIKSC